MNPLNPWVAVCEILILLLLAGLVGYGIAWRQYSKQITQIRREINQANVQIKAKQSKAGNCV